MKSSLIGTGNVEGFGQDKGELLANYLEERGVHFHRGRLGWQKVRCFGVGHLYGDRNPSASVNLTRGYYRCFGCGLHGDVFDLIQAEKGVDFKTAKTMMGADKPKKKGNEPTWI